MKFNVEDALPNLVQISVTVPEISGCLDICGNGPSDLPMCIL